MSGILGLFPGETERLIAPPVPTAPRTAGERYALEYENMLATGLYASAERNEFLEIDRVRDEAQRAGVQPPENFRRRGGALNRDDSYIGPFDLRPARDRVATGRAAWDEFAERHNATIEEGAYRLPTTAEIRTRADQRAAALNREAQAAGQVGGGGFGGFLGTVFGAFSDPVNIATLPLGAPARALAIAESLAVSGFGRAAARIGVTAAGEAAVAAGTQTFIETRAAPYRVSIGLPDTFGDNVIEAAIGGAVLGGGLRGLVEGWRAFRGRVPAPDVATARAEADAASLAREQILADGYRPGGPELHQAHTAAADAATNAVAQGRLPRIETVRQGQTRVAVDAADQAIDPGLPPATVQQRALVLPGGRFNAFTPSGRSVVVEPQVVELSSLIPSHMDDGRLNPAFPHEEGVQPRDRGAAPSQDQIRQIAAGLIPERLMPNREAGFGAPIIAGDQVVESGNGRVLALRQVFADPAFAAQRDAYLAAVREAGFDVAAYEAPVLVARRITALQPEERRAFVQEANNRATLASGTAEQARADAAKLGPALDLYRSGDVDSAGNAGFVRRFLQDLTPEDRGSFIAADRTLSADGTRRIQAALLARAYGDELGVLLTRFLETQNEGFRGLAGALGDVAGDWARMRAAAAAGRIDAAADATAHLASAIRALDEARVKGVSIEEFALQIDLERPPLPEGALAFLAALHRDLNLTSPLASRPAIRARLAGYLDEVQDRQAGPDLLGDGPPPASATIGAVGRRVVDDAPAAPAPGAAAADAAPAAPPAAERPAFTFEAETRAPPPRAAAPNEAPRAEAPIDAPAAPRGADAPDEQASLFGTSTDPVAVTRAAIVEASRANEAARALPGVPDAELAEARRIAAAKDIAVPVLEVDGQPTAGTIGARALLDEAEDAVTNAAEAAACLLGRAA
jgi:hypothetical protein